MMFPLTLPSVTHLLWAVPPSSLSSQPNCTLGPAPDVLLNQVMGKCSRNDKLSPSSITVSLGPPPWAPHPRDPLEHILPRFLIVHISPILQFLPGDQAVSSHTHRLRWLKPCRDLTWLWLCLWGRISGRSCTISQASASLRSWPGLQARRDKLLLPALCEGNLVFNTCRCIYTVVTH